MDLELKLDRQRATSLLQAIGALVGMAGVAGGLAHVTGDSWVPVLRGAGQAMLAALVGFSVMGAVIALAHMLTRHRPIEQGDGDDGLLRVADNRLLTPAPGWTADNQRAYLLAVHRREARFSQRGARDWGDVSADDFNALLRSMVDRGLYETNNDGPYDNGNQGEWTRDGRAAFMALEDDE